MTGVSTSCGACKFLRRKCTNECVFAPYFSYKEAVAHFGAVHKVFGASNVSRLLLHLPEQFRGEAALTISFEALARMRDPVHGCVAYIYALQQELANLQEEIEVVGNQITSNNNTGIIGVPSESLRGSQDNTNNNFNFMVNNNTLFPLNTSNSQEDQIITLPVPDFWIENYQEETVLVLPTHAENGSCNSQMMMNNSATLSFCDFGEQNIIGVNETGSGSHGCFDEQSYEELLNRDSFDNSSPFCWLLDASPSTS